MRLPDRTIDVLTVVALLLPVGSEVAAQRVALQVSENVLVGREPAGSLLLEPHVATHPTDAGHLVAVGWVFPEGENGAENAPPPRCAAFLSRDSGRTWSRHDLAGLSCGDPWVSVTERGAVVTALGSHPSLPDSSTQLLVWFSSDGGVTWSGVPQGLGRGHDGPRSIAGPDGTVYVVSGEAWSDNGGALRFTVPVLRARRGRPYVEMMSRLVPSNLNLNSDGLAILSDGSLVVSYDDYQRNVNRFRSRAGALEGRRSWAVISRDGGLTFSIPLFITESCYDRPVSLAADPSTGPFRDRLYHACSGDDYQTILVNYSADRGEEWSASIPIETPTSQSGARREPQIAVNSQGTVAVAWMDRRDDSAGACYAPYIAASADGGETFGAPVRVAREVSCPDLERTGFAGRRWPTGGDYFGLTAGADGRFHVLWADARSGTFELWTAAISVLVSEAGQDKQPGELESGTRPDGSLRGSYQIERDERGEHVW